MHYAPKKAPFRVPKKLVFTALGCAMTATLACGGTTESHSADAGAVDTGAHDSAVDCDGPAIVCGDGPCGPTGAFYCGTQCPTGCDPFA
jgi:hypothetical protein